MTARLYRAPAKLLDSRLGDERGFEADQHEDACPETEPSDDDTRKPCDQCPDQNAESSMCSRYPRFKSTFGRSRGSLEFGV